MAGRRPPRGAGEGLLRPTPRLEGVLALDDMIAAVVELDANGLCLQWRNHLGGTPPAHLPRWLLMKILAYRIQAAAFGGSTNRRRSAGQAAPGACGASLTSGSIAVRVRPPGNWPSSFDCRSDATAQLGARAARSP